MPTSGFCASNFGKLAAHGSLYLSKVEQVNEHSWLLPYAHYLRQAWQDLGLAGVLCVDKRPTVYVCEAKTFGETEIHERQKYTWNQGLVPLLILLTNSQVTLHSAVKAPIRAGMVDDLIPKEAPSFIQAIDASAMALRGASLVRSIETGQYFQDHAAFFPATESIDACLVSNLIEAARRLGEVKCADWSRERSHALLGRILFVKFLEARGFIRSHHFPEDTGSLEEILAITPVDEAKRLLYREFFGRLRKEFNGTMFDDELKKEERMILRGHLDVLSEFLNVADMSDRQLTLGFWAYDFRCIPVETISSIYEEFMKGEDPQKKRKEGAVYTPRHLTETTLHIALEGRYHESSTWKVLDPACGSGIFLGAMFNLLATQWLRSNPNARRATKAKELLRILQEQIRGVDINRAACRIAAFSLYLALFEKLRPMDLDEFKEQVRPDRFLPSLVWDADADDNPEQPVIIRGDFLKDELPLETDFDLIIGNPPWEGRGETQTALHFSRRVSAFLASNGMGCLLLPSTILVNNNGNLDGSFFGSVTVEKIVQLADFREMLFHARSPCFVLRFSSQPPQERGSIIYETPKVNRYDRRRGVIVVEPDDQKQVLWQEVMQAAVEEREQRIWSRKFWGTPRDESFLGRLDSYPTLLEAKQRKGWGGGVGFKPHYPGCSSGEPKYLAPDWTIDDPFLANDNEFPELVVYDDDLSTLGSCLKNSVFTRNLIEDGRQVQRSVKAALDCLHRKPGEDVFRGPLLVFSQGFTKFAFRAKTMRFEHSLRSITGRTTEDVHILRFLTAVLGSRLMAYHVFHCGSSNGIGRDQLHLHESMALPFPLPDDELAADNAAEILKESSAIISTLERKSLKLSREKRAAAAADARKNLEPLVQEYYSVSDEEKLLIEDTLKLWKPSIHKRNFDLDIPAIAFPEFEERKAYAETLCAELTRFSRSKSVRISAEGKASKELNLVLMTVIFGSRKANYYREVEEDEAFWEALKGVDAAATRENGSLHYLRGFSYFEDDRVHILKPATMRNWSRTAALNDADAIFEHQITHPA